MQDITIQIIVVIFLILFQYLINSYFSVPDIIKLAIHFIIFLESITLVLFYQQYNIFLSFILLFSTIFFSENILRSTFRNNPLFKDNTNILERLLSYLMID